MYWVGVGDGIRLLAPTSLKTPSNIVLPCHALLFCALSFPPPHLFERQNDRVTEANTIHLLANSSICLPQSGLGLPREWQELKDLTWLSPRVTTVGDWIRKRIPKTLTRLWDLVGIPCSDLTTTPSSQPCCVSLSSTSHC